MSLSVENWRAAQRSAARAVYATITNHTSIVLYRANYNLRSGNWSAFPPETIQPNEIVDFGAHASGLMGGVNGFVIYTTRPPPPGPSARPEPGTSFEFQWENPFFGTRRIWSKPPDGLQITESSHLNPFVEVTWVCEPVDQASPSVSSPMSIGMPTRRVSLEADRPTRQSQEFPTTSVTSAPAAQPPSPSLTSNRQVEWLGELQRAIRSVHLVIDNRTECELVRRDVSLSAGWWALLPPERVKPFSQVEFGAFSTVLWTPCIGAAFYKIQLPSPPDAHSDAVFLRGDFNIKWNVPLVGHRTQDTFIPPPLRAEINATGGARAKITVYISQPQQQLTSGVAIPTSAPVKLQLDRRKTVRLLTFNTMLLPPMLTKHDPNKRAALIADRILAEGYDAVCLQEVLHGPARQIIVDRLKDHYPYIVAKTAPNVNINLAAADLEHMLRVGKDSGLFFASKFPIARQEFKIYGVGAGTDSLVQKGCLGIKLDCSSIVPNKSLFVFNTHLQANPDGSLGWKLLEMRSSGAARAREVRAKQSKALYSFISDWIRTEESNRRSTEDLALVCVGDFNIVGEVDQAHGDDAKQTLLTSVLPTIASKLNNKSLRIGTVEQLLWHLSEHSVPVSYIGVLRKLLVSPRDRMLCLIAMIAVMIHQTSVEEMRKLFLPDSGRGLAAVSPSSSSTSAEEYPVDSHQMLPQSAFLDYVAFVYQCVCEKSSLSSDGRISGFWSHILSGIRRSFDGAFFEKEAVAETSDLLHEIQPLRFQLIRAVETVLYVGLTTETIIALIKSTAKANNCPIISADSLADVDWSAPDLPINCHRRPTALEASLHTDVDPSEEYTELLSVLNNPRDLFREKNRLMPGYTVDSRSNSLVRSSGAKRVDYVFLFDKFGAGFDAKKLQHLNCAECRVVPFGDSPTTQLSDHFGVDTLITF